MLGFYKSFEVKRAAAAVAGFAPFETVDYDLDQTSAARLIHRRVGMTGPHWHLKACQLFETLTEAETAQLNRGALVRQVTKGTLVYSPADASTCVLLVVSGRVKMFDLTTDGRESILAFIEPGELFGELAALDGQPQREFAVALETSVIVALKSEAFLSLLTARGDLAVSVTKLVGLRRRRIETRLRNVLFLPSRTRLVRALLELVEAHGEQRRSGYVIRFPLSHQDLAGLIGVSRETVTLTLGQLQSEGLITIARRRVTILDLPRLQREGDVAVPQTALSRDLHDCHSLSATGADRLHRS